MVRARLRGIATATKQLADGTNRTYYYAWRGGPRLLGDPGTPVFMAAYNAAIATQIPEKRADREAPTLIDLIEKFRASQAFKSRSDSTRREYARYLKLIEAKFGTIPIGALADLRARGKFKEWRDSMSATPRKADYAWSVLARLMSFGVDRGELARNPCERGGRLYVANRNEKLWSEESLSRLYAVASPEIAAVVTFALWTGQRQGDCLAAKWSDLQGDAIRVHQGKGNARLMIPLGQVLAETIGKLPRTDTGAILTNTRGQAWTGHGFRTSFGKTFARAGIVDDLHFHDLRGTAVTRLAMAGCTTLQIAAVTGHSPKSVDEILSNHYLGGQAELAEQAMRRLDSDAEMRHQLQTGLQTGKKEAIPNSMPLVQGIEFL